MKIIKARREIVAHARTKNALIKLYTGHYCPYCWRVKRELDRLNLDYEAVDADADGREEVMRLSGQRLIPILTIDDEVLVDSSHIIRELRRRFG
ncbi:MAG: glutaredoxin [Actinomycetota bacterium]|nr:glutaredoxin [Actinomycetota bacterium]